MVNRDSNWIRKKDIMKEKNKSITLVLYLCVFYALWAVFELILKDALNEIIENKVIC